MIQPLPEEEREATQKEPEAVDEHPPASETIPQSETVAQKAGRYERAACQVRLQEAKANSEARIVLQGRITGLVVGLLLGALAFGLHGCGR